MGHAKNSVHEAWKPVVQTLGNHNRYPSKVLLTTALEAYTITIIILKCIRRYLIVKL